jgi:hypothetical protein
MEALLAVAGYTLLPTTIWFFRLGKLFGLNTDVVETNVLNQSAVFLIVVVFIGGAFKDALNTRFKEVAAAENATFISGRQYWLRYAILDVNSNETKKQKIDVTDSILKRIVIENRVKFKRFYKKLGIMLVRERRRQSGELRRISQQLMNQVIRRSKSTLLTRMLFHVSVPRYLEEFLTSPTEIIEANDYNRPHIDFYEGINTVPAAPMCAPEELVEEDRLRRRPSESVQVGLNMCYVRDLMYRLDGWSSKEALLKIIVIHKG